MGSFSIWHWLIVLAVVLLLFGGKGKISAMMGDFGEGLRKFKDGLKADDGSPTGADAPASGAAGDPKPLPRDAAAAAPQGADKNETLKG